MGHNSSGRGAYSATIEESEFPYNSDIAERTVAKIAAAPSADYALTIYKGAADPSVLAELMATTRQGARVQIEARELWNMESGDLLVTDVLQLNE